MTDAPTVIRELDAVASELDELSKTLWQVQQEMVQVQAEYDEWIGEFEEGLWHQHVHGGQKLPSADLRIRLAHRQMDPALLGRYMGLRAKREQYEKRIDFLRTVVNGKRAVLSAFETELRASR